MTLGVLETLGLTPAMVALDTMIKAGDVELVQAELNDNYGICLKIAGPIAQVNLALLAGHRIAETMGGRPISRVIPNLSAAAIPGVFSPSEINPLIQQLVVFPTESALPETSEPGSAAGWPDTPAPRSNQERIQAGRERPSQAHRPAAPLFMNFEHPRALGFLETQGFTAVIDAIDTACKAAHVTVVGKEKLGGGYVTIVIEGELSAVEAAVAAGRERVAALGKLIAAHVIARPQSSILALLPKL